jgi:hypothetical protein
LKLISRLRVLAACNNPGQKFATHLAVIFFQNLKTTNKLSKAKIVFSDEAIFHLSGHINQLDVRIWRSNSPHAVIEVTRNSHKFSVFCTVSKQYVFGLFCFTEWAVTDVVYLGMLEVFLMPVERRRS